jgi:hypothetical protein
MSNDRQKLNQEPTGERIMSEQQSAKEGLKSSAQKEARARDADAPLPASNPVRGAFGGHDSTTQSDQDLSLSIAEAEAQHNKNSAE